jgi:signal transduction histidine kinase
MVVGRGAIGVVDSTFAPDERVGFTRLPRPVTLIATALAGCAAAAVAAILVLASDHVSEPGARAALVVWVILSYVFAGVVAWWRRPEDRFGPFMVATGFFFFLSSLSTANAALPYTVGIAFDLFSACLFLHLFLAFPTGRLYGWFERALVGTAYFVAFGLQLVGMVLGGFGTDNLLELTAEPDAGYTLLRVQLVLLSGSALLGVGVLAVRRRRSGPPLRRSVGLLVDSFALGLLMIALLFSSAAFGWIEGESTFEMIRRITFFVVGLAPLAFLAGLLQIRLARTTVGDLFVELRADPRPADLRDALARALRDPSLALVYWLPEFGSYADLDGRPVELRSDDENRSVTLIDREGAHVAALIHDPALNEEPDLLEASNAAAGIALENARLHAELRARLEELRESRARIIDVSQRERQRLERDLHDGAQQRLIALSLELSALEHRLAEDPETRAKLDLARREIATSLAELRDVAQGIHPAVVTGHGLEIALEQLAARAPVHVTLDVELDGRLSEPLEVASFYLVSESLANIGKHAHATLARVEVCRANGLVVVEVADDGVGGADTELGSGLRGLADRVEALGGRLRVWSPRGGGTRLRAEFPCVP